MDTDDPLSPSPVPAPPPLILEPSIRPTRERKAPQRYTDDGVADSKWKTDQVRAMAAVLNHSNFDPSDWTDIEDILADLDHEETVHHYAPHAMAAFKHSTKPKLYASRKQADQLVQCGLSAVAHMSSARLSGIINSVATSTSIVGNRAEFVSLNTEGGAHKRLDGIAQGLDIQGEGIVEYSLRMDCGSEVTLRSHAAYWVPELGDTRLLSPQSFNTTDGHRGCHGNKTPEGAIDPNSFAEILIRLDGPNWQRNTPVFTATVPYHRGHNLPVIDLLLSGMARHLQQQLILALWVTNDKNRNLTTAPTDGRDCVMKLKNYASVVADMLLNLASNSRPDIAFAVHQAARFFHNPKASYAKAINTLFATSMVGRDLG